MNDQAGDSKRTPKRKPAAGDGKTAGPRRNRAGVRATSLWFLAGGLVFGFAAGLALPRFLPGGEAGAFRPSLAWREDGVLEVRPRDGEAESLPAGVLGALLPAEEAAGDYNPVSAPAENENAGDHAAERFDVRKELGGLPMGSREEFVSHMRDYYGQDPKYLEARWDLAQDLIETGELGGASLEAFLRTPREAFVREKNLARAYDDSWLPIGWGATITDPDVVSMMTTVLDVKPDHKVLEIGTGSGYQSAILAHLANRVYTIEIIAPLFRETDALYRKMEGTEPQIRNIERKLGDGYYGWVKYAPFDRIIVTCAIDHLPPPLLQQLAPDGIMVVPLGPPGRQYIMKVERSKDAEGHAVLKRTDVYNGLEVKFIPFRDESGHSYSGKAKSGSGD
jgi:protein-L-isoaspartate(D-aspartate) O-methyltransferase